MCTWHYHCLFFFFLCYKYKLSPPTCPTSHRQNHPLCPGEKTTMEQNTSNHCTFLLKFISLLLIHLEYWQLQKRNHQSICFCNSSITMSQAQANKKVSVLISYSHSYDAMDKLCRPFKYHVTHPALPSRKKIIYMHPGR